MKVSLARLQTTANVAGASLLLWLAAPLVSVDGRHPFDSIAARAGALLVTGLLAGVAWATVQQMRRRRNARLFSQLQGGSATAALVERFVTAVQLLQTGIAVKGERTRWWSRRRS